MVFRALHKPLPHRPPHRRVLVAESGLLLPLDPTQHLFNARLDPHVVQSHCCPCNRVPRGLQRMHPTLPFRLSFLPALSRRNEGLLFDFRAKAFPAPALWNALPSVHTTSRVPLSVSVYCIFGFPFLFQAQSLMFQACFTIVVSQIFSQSSRRSLGANIIFCPACFVPGNELLVFWRSSAVCVNSDYFLSSSSSFFVMNLSLVATYRCPWHLHT